MIITDNFIDSYDELKNYSAVCDFSDIKNPTDSVVYPDICAEIPEGVEAEVLQRIHALIGHYPEDVTMFLRMSKKGCHCPHPIHHDLSMGRHSLMLYLSSRGGTRFVRHNDTGITYAPQSETVTKLIREEAQILENWTIYDGAEMTENRGLIFDAGMFHMADPIGGYGETQEDARIVLTCFFS